MLTMRSLSYASMLATCFVIMGCQGAEKEKNTTSSTQQKTQDSQSNPLTTKNEKTSMENNIITTPSGLSYKVMRKAAEGAAQPKAGQIISAHYTGWLQENGTRGKKFDSSFDRNQPLSFKVGVGQVIKGWDEALLDMKVGEKRELTIPAHLGYGSRGAGGVIPPDATLIFEVELCSIKS